MFTLFLVFLGVCGCGHTQQQENSDPPQLSVEQQPGDSAKPPSAPLLHLKEEGVLGVQVTPNRKLIPNNHTKEEILALNIFTELAISLQFVLQDGKVKVMFIENPIRHYLPTCDLGSKICPETEPWIARHQKLYAESIIEVVNPKVIKMFKDDDSFTVFYEPQNPNGQQLLLCGQRQKSGLFARLEDMFAMIYGAGNFKPSTVKICRFIPWRKTITSFAADIYNGWSLRMAVIDFFRKN